MILAIETSCDETAAAVVEKSGDAVRVLSSVVSSQIALHAPFGGVVPNLAAREHTKNIVPVIESALREASASMKDIAAIAVTAGPGLAPALQIGVTAAKSLAYLWRKPLLPIHHIEGHIYANFIKEEQPATGNPHNRKSYQESEVGNGESKNSFPLLALVVSGGHTELVFMRDHFTYDILGETEDDAVGEAFDKVAKMLDLPYPGGPEIAKRADAFRRSAAFSSHNSANFSFPRPMKESGDYRFSFSGLKTAVLYFLKKHETQKQMENFINAVCFEFQESALDVLIEKTRRALAEYHPETAIIAGGVSANIELRHRMGEMIGHDFPDTCFLMPPFKYSLDNAAMIGAAAVFRWDCLSDTEKSRTTTLWRTLRADPNMKLCSIGVRL
ncbi:MAG: tRNA (adenosine(37)-N6)-threonylcarbamoyltransferase complex transferase subunit TsaD [Candidatus Moraniibacteriota bacterium]|nr:MAG: tRNA (adenosine(37)-N6)-threonylcarbamoyltransferase complex transferase subunit TsaD [Candidatus Moranbacteria bacterium]